MASYRLRVDVTFSTQATALAAQTSMNAVLAAQGFNQTVTLTSNTVTLVVPGIETAAKAKALNDALVAGWGRTGRAGVAAVSLVPA